MNIYDSVLLCSSYNTVLLCDYYVIECDGPFDVYQNDTEWTLLQLIRGSEFIHN